MGMIDGYIHKHAPATTQHGAASGVRDTSRAAYRGIQRKLGAQHERILALFPVGSTGLKTRAEIANQCGLPTSTVSARVNELIKLNRLREPGTRFVCIVSGKKVHVVGLC